MKNYVTSKNTGSKFEIEINLPYGVKGGANYSSIFVAGEWRRADWFVSDDGILSCLCLFTVNGQQADVKGVATVEDSDLLAWIENKVTARKAEKEREANYRAGQEFDY